MIAPARLDAAIRAAAGYLVGNCNTSGQFEYRIKLNDSVAVEPRYNLVRHAGCIYAIVRYCQAIDDTAAREVLRRASGTFHGTAIDQYPRPIDSLSAPRNFASINARIRRHSSLNYLAPADFEAQLTRSK